jgi:hypothetical protein
MDLPRRASYEHYRRGQSFLSGCFMLKQMKGHLSPRYEGVSHSRDSDSVRTRSVSTRPNRNLKFMGKGRRAETSRLSRQKPLEITLVLPNPVGSSHDTYSWCNHVPATLLTFHCTFCVTFFTSVFRHFASLFALFRFSCLYFFPFVYLISSFNTNSL